MPNIFSKNYLSHFFFWLCIPVALYFYYLKQGLYYFYAVLPLLSLIFIYISYARKKDLFFIIFLLFYAFADALFVSGNYVIGTLSYALCNLLLLKVFFDNKIEFAFKKFINYLLLFLALFFIVYFTVIDKQLTGNFPVIIYGLTLTVLVAFAFIFYLNKMNTANLIIFIGIFLKIISDCLFSIDMYNTFNNPYVIICIQALYFIALYVITIGFSKK